MRGGVKTEERVSRTHLRAASVSGEKSPRSLRVREPAAAPPQRAGGGGFYRSGCASRSTFSRDVTLNMLTRLVHSKKEKKRPEDPSLCGDFTR